MSNSLKNRVLALELARTIREARNVFELSDPELLRLAGLAPGATDAEFLRVADGLQAQDQN